jgi:hypothetical protein
MSSLINNALQPSVDVVTLNQVRLSSVKNEISSNKINPRNDTSITLPEDVVTLSSANLGEGATSSQKKPSVAVSHDEKQALLASYFSPKGFSVYG